MSTTPATTPGSGLAEAILKLRSEINVLAKQMVDSGDKTKEESDALLELFQRRKAHLDAMVSVASAPNVGALANGVPVSGLSSVVSHDLPTFPWSGFVEDKSLRTRAEVTDKHVVTKIFFDAFPANVSRLMMVSMGQAPESAFYDNILIFTNGNLNQHTKDSKAIL